MPSPGRWRTVRRLVAGWNEPAPRSPSRGSGAFADGVTNRAVWRAAYRAAMLRSMGGNGSASVRRCKRETECGPQLARGFRCQRAPPLGDLDLAVRELAIERRDARRDGPNRVQVSGDRPAIAARRRARQG